MTKIAFCLQCVILALSGPKSVGVGLITVKQGLKMKKIAVVVAIIALAGAVAGCTTVGKAPVGKGPVVTKG
jgi:hypothetical protein